MAALTVQTLTLTGVAPTYNAAAAGGDTFVNNGKTFLHVKNTGASTTVTVDSVTACNQGSDHDSVTTVPATTGDRMIGPFEMSRFNSGTGTAAITYSQVTGITVAVVSL